MAIGQTNAGLVKTLRGLQETALSNKNSVIGRWASDKVSGYGNNIVVCFPCQTFIYEGRPISNLPKYERTAVDT